MNTAAIAQRTHISRIQMNALGVVAPVTLTNNAPQLGKTIDTNGECPHKEKNVRKVSRLGTLKAGLAVLKADDEEWILSDFFQI